MEKAKKTKSAKIYLPNGETANFEEGKEIGDVKNIYLFNSNAISIVHDDDTESIYVNMPFVYNC